MKKTISILICVILLAGLLAPAAFAVEETAAAPEETEAAEEVEEAEEPIHCVVVGADLNDEQIESVYRVFGLERGSVPELTLTNAEERALLSGKVDESLIGEYSVSCVYIRLESEGAGTDISLDNITWCTADMYRQALATAGINDVRAIIASPFQVSGTAALAGIYKAYETLTGSALDEEAKELGTLELLTAAGLADQLGAADAGEIVGEMKTILDQTREMSDEELREKIRSVASGYGFTLNDAQVEQIFDLCRRMESLNLRDLINKAGDAVDRAKELGEKAKDLGEKAETVAEKLRDFFAKAAELISDLLGK